MHFLLTNTALTCLLVDIDFTHQFHVVKSTPKSIKPLNPQGTFQNGLIVITLKTNNSLKLSG